MTVFVWTHSREPLEHRGGEDQPPGNGGLLVMSELSDPLVILRILCGVWFIPHCVGKMRNIDAAAMNTYKKAGFPYPHAWVLVTIALEMIAATGLILGIHARVAAAVAVVVLMGAAFAVIKINGFVWRWQKQGPEYMIFWSIACVLAVVK